MSIVIKIDADKKLTRIEAQRQYPDGRWVPYRKLHSLKEARDYAEELRREGYRVDDMALAKGRLSA